MRLHILLFCARDWFSLCAQGCKLVIQPRGNKLRPLVSEFEAYRACVFPARSTAFLDAFLSKCPKGSRVTSRRLTDWDKLQSECDLSTFEVEPTLRNLEVWSKASVELCHVGIPCKPEEFVRRAIAAGHPRGTDIHLTYDVEDAVRWNFESPAFELAKLRVEFVRKWSGRAKELEESERELHATFPPHLKQVLSGKRLLLFRELVEASRCPDTGLVDDICNGFKLSGWLPDSGNFSRRLKSPEYDLDCLKKISSGLSAAVKNFRQDAELESACWEETKKELEQGWVWVDSDPPDRFGVQQGPKVRVIDDCSVGGLNKTIGP